MKKYQHFAALLVDNPSIANSVGTIRQYLKPGTIIEITGNRAIHNYPIGSRYKLTNPSQLIISNHTSNRNNIQLTGFTTQISGGTVYCDDIRVYRIRTKSEIVEELKSLNKEYKKTKEDLEESLEVLDKLGLEEEDSELVKSYRILNIISSKKEDKDKALAIAELLKS